MSISILRGVLPGAAFVFLVTSPVFADPVYHVNYLGFGFVNGLAAGLNDFNQVVGKDSQKGFLYDSGAITPISTLGGPAASSPGAINNAGQVAGYSLTSGNAAHAFIYQAGSLTDLGALPGFPSSVAAAINASGDVVGRSSTGDLSSSHAFLYHNGSLIDLGNGVANGINSSGVIVGTSQATRAVIYQGGSMTDLGNFGFGTATHATDINDAGQIIGYNSVKVGSTFANHPFLYQSGTWTDLGLPAGVPAAYTTDINNHGQVIGNSNQSLGSVTNPPFLYTDGVNYNLDTLLDSSGAGLSLELVYGINDNGVILAEGFGIGSHAGYQAVLLTPVPVPEPSSLLIGAVASALCITFRRRSARAS